MLTGDAGALRVLLTADTIGGVWRHALDVAAELARRGARPCIVTWGPEPTGHQRAEAAAARVELAQFEAPLEWMGDEAAARATACRLEAFVRAWSPSLLHLNAPALAAFMAGSVPCVAMLHSCLATWWQAMRGTPLPEEWRWHQRATGAGLAAADVAVSPSAAFADAMTRVYGRLPRLFVAHNGAPARRRRAKEPLVLAAGRWWDDAKDAACLDAAATCSRTTIHAAGPVRAPHGAERRFDRVRWIGDLPHGDLLEWLDRASIFVSPARYEPFGLSVLEAAGAGAALVLSDIPAFRELWAGCAWFVAPGDARGLARAVDRLADLPAERARLAQAALERSARFSIGAQVDALLVAYDAALSTRARAA